MNTARFPKNEDFTMRLINQQDDILDIIKMQGECIEHLQNQLTILGEFCLRSAKGGND